MAAIAFDTLQSARRLRAAGFPEQQADELAEIMAEAFVHNVDQLVTRDYLDTRLRELETRFDGKLAELDNRLSGQITELDARFTRKFVEIDGKFRLVYWMLAVIIASTTVPALGNLLT